MRQLTPQGQKIIEDVAARHGISAGAATSMLRALLEGGGTMAQFDHAEFGGMGQWTQGGMIMVGDMFNNALKAKVDAVCSDLAGLLSADPALVRTVSHQSQRQSQGQGGFSGGSGAVSLFVPASGGGFGGWWPPELGTPSSTGSQNDIHYAVFPATRRLATEIRGRVTVYDTADHRITGVSQQQSGDASVTFVSQNGLVRVAELQVVDTGASEVVSSQETEAPTPAAPEPASPSAPPPSPAKTAPAAAAPAAVQETSSDDEIFTKIERLAELHKKGILSDEEFGAKKTDLLSRL